VSFASNDLKCVRLKQNIEELRARLVFVALFPLLLGNHFEMRQPSIGIDLARLLVVEKGKVETEGRDVYGFLIDVNARDLFAQNPSKLRTTDLLTTLLRVKMAHHPPKDSTKKMPEPQAGSMTRGRVARTSGVRVWARTNSTSVGAV